MTIVAVVIIVMRTEFNYEIGAAARGCWRILKSISSPVMVMVVGRRRRFVPVHSGHRTTTNQRVRVRVRVSKVGKKGRQQPNKTT